MNEQFKRDVDIGLSQSPKSLSSKYFYDDIGDDLFMQIMAMPEYYLTNAELEIFKEQAEKVIENFGVSKGTYFELIELGAGDGMKTKHLLRSLLDLGYDFKYMPIDISQNVLDILESTLIEVLPDLNLEKLQGDYFEMLEGLRANDHQKVVLFLGSNLGNMSDDIAASFIYNLGSNLRNKDKLVLGLDLIKDKSIVLPAYDDQQGITSKFNLNLLNRINRELGADFVVGNFLHQPEYDENEGIAKSYITSQIEQSVYISALEKSFHFKNGEKISTEISRKYNNQILETLISATDFTIVDKLTDSNSYFADFVLEKSA